MVRKIGRYRIEFQGKKFLFIGYKEPSNGAIATQEQYENFEDSYAHLDVDGKIRRHRRVIGTERDIKWL